MPHAASSADTSMFSGLNQGSRPAGGSYGPSAAPPRALSSSMRWGGVWPGNVKARRAKRGPSGYGAIRPHRPAGQAGAHADDQPAEPRIGEYLRDIEFDALAGCPHSGCLAPSGSQRRAAHRDAHETAAAQ